MNLQKEFIKQAIADGSLELHGDAYFIEGETKEMIFDHQEQPSPTTTSETEYEFYNAPDQYGCRPNKIAEAVINEFAAGDKYQQEAAKNAPRLFPFVDEGWNPTPEQEAVYRANNQRTFNYPMVTEYKDLNGNVINGRWFIPLKNDSFPHPNRDAKEVSDDIRWMMRLWLLNATEMAKRTIDPINNPRG